MPARIVDERHVRESPADIDPDPPGHAAFAPLGGGFIVDWPFDIAEGLSSIWPASQGRPGTTVAPHNSYPPPPDRSSLPRCRERPGVTIRDAAGKDYIDASSGAAVSCLGHSHPDVLAAMRQQLDRLAYVH